MEPAAMHSARTHTPVLASFLFAFPRPPNTSTPRCLPLHPTAMRPYLVT